jgi:V/A-type H+-transporting ATPase subunit K
MRRGLLALAIFTTIAFLAATSLIASAQGTAAAQAAVREWKAMAAAITMGVSALGSGYALAKAGSAASAAAAERPEVAGRLLIYLVLGEGIAIYGLLVAILIIFTG